ncbi:MAG: fkbM [Rubritepida sp.]|nr:fkbM [Rubritepida sp.]
MTQDAENVRWAYRMVLGRDAENEAVTEAWSHRPPRDLLNALATSPEALSPSKAGQAATAPWMRALLPPAAVTAAYRLLRGADPSEEEVAAALRAHASPASFRRSLLEWIRAGEIPAEPESREEKGFHLLGQRFTLRATGRESSWHYLAQDLQDPRIERLARVAAAAFPDGGAGRVLVDAHAASGIAGIAMAAALPYHACLLGIEPEAEAAALLRHNLAANELHETRLAETALGAEDRTDLSRRRLDGILAEQGLERLDLLRLAADGHETAAMIGAAQAIRRDRPMVFAEFNLWTLMTVARENPLAVLEEWHAAFPHLVGFDDDGNPLPFTGAEGLPWLLHAVLNRRGGVDDVVLCHDLGWVERWA